MTPSGVLVGALLILSGAALTWVSWLGSQRRLPRNSWVGLRVPSTMADDEAWAVAHESAAGPLGVAGGVCMLGGLGVVTVGLDHVVGVSVLAVSGTATVVLALVAARVGVRAARGTRRRDAED